MPRSPDVENYMLGKGQLFFDRFDADGNSTGEFDLGNVPDFSITPAVEQLDHYSSMGGVKEKDKTATTSIGATCKFTLEEFSLWNLMLMNSSRTEGTFTQASGHQVNEPLTAHSGKWTKLSRRHIHTVTVTNETGIITYVDGVDYRMDRPTGRLFTIEEGAIADGQVLHIDYLYSDAEHDMISGLEDTDIEGALRFIGTSDVGPRYEAEIWRIKIKPAGEMGLITEEWANVPIEAEILKDSAKHPTDPWYTILDLENDSAVS